jgi:serine phosphatase RsbU (regulator of sigma subunit)
MSMISYQKLDEAVSKLREPKNILKRLNKKIKSVLKQKFEDSISRDGLDISLISCNFQEDKTLKVKYAGANRPVWIIRNNVSGFEIEEPELTKASIGGFTEFNQEYKQSEFLLRKEDTIYLFSDGFADQFGGAKNKKITTKNFKKLLLEIQQYSMKDQQELIVKYLNDWKGNRGQIDDILVIGIRV